MTGHSEGRFKITYCPSKQAGGLSREDIEGPASGATSTRCCSGTTRRSSRQGPTCGTTASAFSGPQPAAGLWASKARSRSARAIDPPGMCAAAERPGTCALRAPRRFIVAHSGGVGRGRVWASRCGCRRKSAAGSGGRRPLARPVPLAAALKGEPTRAAGARLRRAAALMNAACGARLGSAVKLSDWKLT